jgi:hypothetical protein
MFQVTPHVEPPAHKAANEKFFAMEPPKDLLPRELLRKWFLAGFHEGQKYEQTSEAMVTR